MIGAVRRTVSPRPWTMAKAQHHRRTHPRYEVEGIRGHFALNADVDIVDVSVNGVGIETHTYLGVGRDYSLRVTREEGDLRLTGRVVWCTLVRTERNGAGDIFPVYRAGIRFRDILSDDGREWIDFLGERAVVSPDPRLFGRFALDEGSEVDLEGGSSFEVISLSLGGMLIEIPYPDEARHGLVGQTLRLDITLEEGLRLRAEGEGIYSMEPPASPKLVPAEGVKDETASRIRLGVRFVRMSRADREALTGFVTSILERAGSLLSPADPQAR